MNARPLDETISQSGPGFPDDTSQPVELAPEEEKTLERTIRKHLGVGHTKRRGRK